LHGHTQSAIDVLTHALQDWILGSTKSLAILKTSTIQSFGNLSFTLCAKKLALLSAAGQLVSRRELPATTRTRIFFSELSFSTKTPLFFYSYFIREIKNLLIFLNKGEDNMSI